VIQERCEDGRLTDNCSSGSSGLATWAIVVIIVAAVVAVLIAVGIIVYCCKRPKAHDKLEPTDIFERRDRASTVDVLPPTQATEMAPMGKSASTAAVTTSTSAAATTTASKGTIALPMVDIAILNEELANEGEVTQDQNTLALLDQI
jgi:hypothetical protein